MVSSKRDGNERAMLYRTALDWIIAEKAGANGWPPQDIAKVSGWMVTRLVGGVFERKPREVARDLIGRFREREHRNG
jgi:hypothetical protein